MLGKLINVKIINIAFPIDIIIGPPRPIYNKIRMSFILKLIGFLLYLFIAYK